MAVLVISADGEEGPQVHFEAFQCSAQCVKLWREGWIHEMEGEPSGVSRMVNPKEPDNQAPVMIVSEWRAWDGMGWRGMGWDDVGSACHMALC